MLIIQRTRFKHRLFRTIFISLLSVLCVLADHIPADLYFITNGSADSEVARIFISKHAEHAEQSR